MCVRLMLVFGLGCALMAAVNAISAQTATAASAPSNAPLQEGPVEALSAMQQACQDGDAQAFRSYLHTVTPAESVAADAMSSLIRATVRYRRVYSARLGKEPHKLPMNLSSPRELPPGTKIDIRGDSATLSWGSPRTTHMVRTAGRWRISAECIFRELSSSPVEDLGVTCADYAANVEFLADQIESGALSDAERAEEKLLAVRREFMKSTRGRSKESVDLWEEYVKRYCLLFKLDTGQRHTASSLLREFQGRRDRYLRDHARDVAGSNPSGGPSQQGPRGLWEEMIGRLDRIPTRSQVDEVLQLSARDLQAKRSPSALALNAWPLLGEQIAKSQGSLTSAP